MDVAALSLKIDSSDVLKAANDLDRFAAASTRAGAAAGNPSGSIAKLVASVQSIDSKMSALISTLSKVQQAEKAMSAANDNSSRSLASTDAHVTAYTQHLASMVTAANAAAASSGNVAASTGRASTAFATLTGSVQASMGAISQYTAKANSISVNFAGVGKAAGEAAVGVGKIPEAIKPIAPALDHVTTSAGQLRANTGNIAAQFQDIGVTAAMGMNPLIIALQQGTQLSAVFAQSGGSMASVLGAAFKQVFSAQALLTIAVIAGAVALFQWAASAGKSADEAYRAENGLKTYTTAMGYTKAEVEKLNGVTVSFGDTIKAVFQVGFQSAVEAMGISVDDMSKMWDGFLDRLASGTRATLAGIYAGFAGTRAYLAEIEKGGLLGLGGMIIGQGDPDILKKTYGKAYNDAQSGIDAIIAQAQKNAQGRQSDMASKMYDTPSASGGKTDAEKLADIIRNAEAAITVEQDRMRAVDMSARAAAEMEQQTKLLNQVQKAGIPVTAGVRAEIDRLAKSYADAKIAADIAETIRGVTEGIEKQSASINDQTVLIGLYGDELTRTRIQMEKLTEAQNALPRGELLSVDASNAVSSAAAKQANDQILQDRLKRTEDLRKSSEDLTYAMDLERAGLGLAGEAALEYAFVVERLNEAKRAGIDLSPDEIAAIEKAADAYAQQRYAIDQQAQRMSDAREVTRGFALDAINGLRESGNAFKAFADAATNALDRVIDKLLDRTLDGFLDSMFKGGSSSTGGFFGSVLNSVGLGKKSELGGINASTQAWLDAQTATPRGFAKGGTFTNSIVNTPTLFRFANGAALGEMGEAGPEAIMPLKRGANGALGVQASGGGSRKAEINISQEFRMEGVMTPADVMAMVRQGGAAAVQEVKRNLDAYLREWEMDGAVSA